MRNAIWQVFVGAIATLLLVGMFCGCGGYGFWALAKMQANTKSTPKAPLTRREQIAQHFSPLDGHCYTIETAIKKQLNDPGSYQHAKTVWIDEGSTVFVVTEIRAKNPFGAMILTTFHGRISFSNGYVIEVHEGEPDLSKVMPYKEPTSEDTGKKS